MPVPFGVNGPREELLETSLAGNRSASYADGFPPITMLLKQAGGLPPKGENMNQILFELANGQRWSNSGAGYKFNEAFSEAVGGYPKGAQLLSNDGTKVYVSTKDDNKTDFNTSPDADWVTLGNYIGLNDYALKTDVDKKLDKSAVVQTTGTSTTSVMSQKAVTDLANTKADGDRFSTKTSSVLMSPPNSKYGVEISNSGIFAVADLSGEAPVPIFRVLSTGEINDGSIALARVTGAGSAASKNTGTNPGQIPDMSSFGFANGAYTFPNGLILQVFSVTPSAINTVTPITFPVPFPNNPHGVWPTHNSSPSGQYMTLDTLTKTGANMRVFRSDSTSPVTGAGTVTIMALGR